MTATSPAEQSSTQPDAQAPAAVSRRAIARGVVWAVPTAVVATAAPAFAASPLCNRDVSWFASSRIVANAPNSSTSNFDATVKPTDTPPGVLEVQHWASASATNPRLNWRIAMAFPANGPGAQAGATFVIPLNDPMQTNRSTMNTVPSDYTVFLRVYGQVREQFTRNLPAPTVTQTATEIRIVFPTAIQPGSAGLFSFQASPVDGNAGMTGGTTYTQSISGTFVTPPC
ncbi:MAG: hypothetical protein Q4G21_01565 [Dermabacter sp.]|nr:hypothetical protein [Dermabacter sp.]